MQEYRRLSINTSRNGGFLSMKEETDDFYRAREEDREKVISCLFDYVESLSKQEYCSDDYSFLGHIACTLAKLHTYFTSSIQDESSAHILNYMEHLIKIILDTVYITARTCVCTHAIRTSVLISSKFREDLYHLTDDVTALKYLVLQLSEYGLKLSRTSTKSCKKLDEEIFTFGAIYIKDMNSNCKRRVEEIVKIVDVNLLNESKFFGATSFSLGAICAGRFLWALAGNICKEKLIQVGLWSVCVGFSAVVLTIPRNRAQRIIDDIDFNQREYSSIRAIVKHWQDDLTIRVPNDGHKKRIASDISSNSVMLRTIEHSDTLDVLFSNRRNGRDCKVSYTSNVWDWSFQVE